MILYFDNYITDQPFQGTPCRGIEEIRFGPSWDQKNNFKEELKKALGGF